MNTSEFVELKNELTKKMDRLAEIVDGAQRANRDLSRRERAELDQMNQDTAALRDRIPRFDPRQAQGFRNSAELVDGNDSNSPVLRPEQRVMDRIRERQPQLFRSSLWDELLDPSRMSLGRMVREMVTGDWRNADMERRAMLEGTPSAGSALLPTPMSGTLIDRIRNAARVMQAGASTVVMTEQLLLMGRLTSGPTPGLSWHTEGAQIGTSDRQVDKITFTAKTLPSLTLISYELLNDMTDAAAQMLENEIVKSMALEIDRVCLRGAGVDPEPCGIRNVSGVTITSLGATGNWLLWDTIIDGVSTLRKANVEPNAMILSARSEQTLGKLKIATGAYYEPPSAIAGVQRLVSNQVPDNVGYGSACSEVYIGDWSSLMLGVRETSASRCSAQPAPHWEDASESSKSGMSTKGKRGSCASSAATCSSHTPRRSTY